MDKKVPSTYISEFLSICFTSYMMPKKSCHFYTNKCRHSNMIPYFWQSHSPLWLAHNGQIPSGCYWIIKWYIFVKSCRAHVYQLSMNHEKVLVGDLGQALVESWAIALALWGWWLEYNHLSNSSKQSLVWGGTLDHTSRQFDYIYFCIHIYIWIWNFFVFICALSWLLM
jgi:hypothetical protein